MLRSTRASSSIRTNPHLFSSTSNGPRKVQFEHSSGSLTGIYPHARSPSPEHRVLAAFIRRVLPLATTAAEARHRDRPESRSSCSWCSSSDPRLVSGLSNMPCGAPLLGLCSSVARSHRTSNNPVTQLCMPDSDGKVSRRPCAGVKIADDTRSTIDIW